MEDIRLIQTADMKCDEAAIATVATWWGRHYEMAFSGLWGLNFLPKDPAKPDLIGKRIQTPDERIKYVNLKRYHNILTTPYDCENSEEFMESFFNEQINGHPVMMDINPANKPWATKNDFSDGLSFILVYRYEKQKNGFYCVDIHSSKKVELLPLQNLVQESKSRETFRFACFSKLEEAEPPIDWRAVLKESADSICKTPKNNYFASVKMLADSFLHIDLDAECGDLDFFLSPICWNMRNICRYRNLYSLSLAYLSKKSGVKGIEDLAKMFNLAGSKWYFSLTLLTKSFYKKKIEQSTMERIRENLYSVADFEKEICGSIYDLCCCEPLTAAGAAPKSSSEPVCREQYLQLPLEHSFNNKAFYTDEHLDDFDGTGSCFLKENLPDGGLVRFEKKAYDLKNCLCQEHDNISCRGQTIRIDFKENVQNVYFLCCAEWGNFYEKIKIIFEDDCAQDFYLTFADWVYKTTYEGLSVAWQGKGMYEDRKRVAEVFLFEQIFSVNGRRLKAIELPDSPNCHIFAVTLGY